MKNRYLQISDRWQNEEETHRIKGNLLSHTFKFEGIDFLYKDGQKLLDLNNLEFLEQVLTYGVGSISMEQFEDSYPERAKSLLEEVGFEQVEVEEIDFNEDHEPKEPIYKINCDPVIVRARIKELRQNE